jgi:hypothetical protein
MLLVLTNSDDATADHLISVLNRHVCDLVRFDTDTLVAKALLSYQPGRPRLCFGGRWYKPSDFQHVWYRRPERLKSDRVGDSPETKYVLDEWAEALESFLAHIPKWKWMNHPASNALASHKLEQLTTARALGFQIPDTVVSQDQDVLRAFFERHQGAVVVKPMAGGYIERSRDENDSLIYTNRVSASDLINLDDIESCPTLFQRFIRKRCDVRITIVDDACHASG